MSDLSGSDLADLCVRLRRIPVAVVSDILGHAQLPDRVLSASIARVNPCERFAGPAVCFSGRAGPEPAGLTGTARLIYEADRRIAPGSVVVLGTGGFRAGAVLGGNTLAGWRKRGCAGVVTDGFARDVDEYEGLPTFAAGITPQSSGGRWAWLSLEAPVALPGQSSPEVLVHPGDLVHGDRDGVVVIPGRHLAQVVADAEIAEAVEQRMRRCIEDGRDRGEVYLSHDRFGHVRPLAAG